jgi:predicted esterase
MKTIALVILILSSTFSLRAQTTNSAADTPPWPPNIDEFTVETNSPENKLVPFYVRIPAGFDPQQPGPYRILFMCPPINHDGFLTVTGRDGNKELFDVADQRKWFIITATFKQYHGEVQDRDTSYYYPEKFSGKAVMDALDEIAQKYPLDVSHLFVTGMSGGAQFTHRFALWAPTRVVAAAINSCRWFDDPSPTCNQVAWLLTIGESDDGVENMLSFDAKLQDAGAAPIFRSYLGMVHDEDKRVTHLDAEFLKFYDDRTHDQLGKASDPTLNSPTLAMQSKDMPFVGDNQTWEYVPNTDANRGLIAEDLRVYLPSKELADVWGTPKQ